MSARTFVWYVLLLLAGSLVLVWTVVSLAAVVYAVTVGEPGSVALYAAFAAAGVGLLIAGAVIWRRFGRQVGQ